MTESDDKKSRSLALSALLLAEAQSHPDSKTDNAARPLKTEGDRPTEDEIWNWMHDDVSETRALEIRTHLALDKNLYETWRQLRLARAELKTEEQSLTGYLEQSDLPPEASNNPAANIGNDQAGKSDAQNRRSRLGNVKRIEKRKSIVAGAGIAIAASLTALLLIGPLQQTATQDFWINWQSPKSTLIRDLSKNEQIALARVVGAMKTELELNELPAIGPNGEPLSDGDCNSIAPCIEHEDKLVQLGSAITRTRLLCVQESSMSMASLRSLASSSLNAKLVPELALIHAPLVQLAEQVNEIESAGANSGVMLEATQPICTITDLIIQRILIAK